MDPDYKTYLAAKVLNEDQIVTYRQLSRALKAPANRTKEMLYEFHRLQNGKKPSSVHATYIVAGRRRKTEIIVARDGEDDFMQSSPFQSSSVAAQEDAVEESDTLSITLVREEDMDELRSLYELITAVHIYSLGPSPIKNLQILSDSARELSETYAGEDPLVHSSIYGTIVNRSVRRRTDRRPLPPGSAVVVPHNSQQLKPSESAGSQTVFTAPKPLATEKEETLSKSTKPSRSAAKDFFDTSHGGKMVSNNPPHLKRDSSNLFKSFAKAASRSQRESTDSSGGASGLDAATRSEQDEHMMDASEDEDDPYIPPPQPLFKELADSNRKLKIEREAALKKMMEDDESEEEALLGANAEPSQPKELANTLDLAETVQVNSGRKRGRRRVMKKKTVKDEEGYLVTKEEPAWESFSEDEPAARKPQAVASVPAKPRKGSNKPVGGQGNIMSFFGKK